MARLGLYVALAFILGATLFPTGTELPEFIGCIVCGSRGWADAVVNVLLFVPLGAALKAVGRTGRRPIVYGFALSCAVEFAQTLIPGRDPSLGDVCFNTIGTALGQVVARCVARWTTPVAKSAARLSMVAALAAIGVFGLTGWLLAPALPVSAFRAWYTADRPELEFYHGHVLATSLGSVPFGTADMPDPLETRRLLLGGAPLRILAVAGPRIGGLGPLFVIEDRRGDEVFLIGPDRDDLAIRFRTRAAAWRLDQPDLRLRRAFAGVSAGDTLRIEARRDRGGYCLAVNQRQACGLGFTVGSGWTPLLYPRHFPPWLQTALSIGWVAGLVLPLGFWARRRWETGVAGAMLLTGLAIVPGAVGLIPTPPPQWMGAGAGLLLGMGVQGMVRRASRRSPNG